MTVTMYILSCLATTSRSPMAAIFPAMSEAMPAGEYLHKGAESPTRTGAGPGAGPGQRQGRSPERASHQDTRASLKRDL